MFDYKEASFYTSYFNKTPGFNVKEEFKESDDKEEKNLYVGYVEVLNTIYPLIVRVEIPKSFPHQRLIFRTKSLSGYPHLIHTGKTQYGDWFCLNTPFAESAEEQLNQEVNRLKQWIYRQMREDLPPIINDPDVIKALRRNNVLEWENEDEINEIRSDASLTFVGDFSNDLNYFQKDKGNIHCVITKDKRLYAFRSKEFTNFELPYIIVDESPKENGTRSNFVSLRDQYGWDKTICEHLLPGFLLHQTWKKNNRYICAQRGYSVKDLSLEQSLEKINRIKEELAKEESYLPLFNDDKTEKVLTKIYGKQKELLGEAIDEIEKEVKKNNGFHPFGSFRLPLKSYDEMSEDERMEEDFRQQQEDYYLYEYPYEYVFFALGVKRYDHIDWSLYLTYRECGKYEKYSFDIGLREVILEKLISHEVYSESAQIITEKMFFGRGMFSQKLKERRIALVGLGAIGSMVAVSLARSGITVLGLWDNDIVEPGNICRSAYQITDLGESKVDALAKQIRAINPYVKFGDIKRNGYWASVNHSVNNYTYIEGSFYNNINYDNQEDSLKKIRGYDMIIDCTGSNEILHFLSYAVPETYIVSLCITNHSNELLCVTSNNGNPFELRKTYLSRIEQDTKNFYLEGSGCYSPTFLATNSDIASLINLFLRELNGALEKDNPLNSMVFSHTKRGIVIDRFENFQLKGYGISMVVPTETMYDAEELDDVPNGNIGYVLGNYSRDGKLVMVTHVISPYKAQDKLLDAFNTSKGIIDYIGDFAYSGAEPGSINNETMELIASKANDDTIDTNNPLLIIRNPNRSLSYFLYINGRLVPFDKQC